VKESALKCDVSWNAQIADSAVCEPVSIFTEKEMPYIVHEIRKPLQNILSVLNLLELKRPNDPLLNRYLMILYDELQREDDFLADILDYFCHKHTDLNKVFCNLDIILQQVIELLRSKAILLRVQFQEEYAPGLPPVFLDKNKTKQVLVNLLVNALEAFEETPKTDALITIRAYLEGNNLIITISDNANGMLPDVLNRCLNPFFTTKSGGTGLGLPFCSDVIARHNGCLTIDSILYRGTTAKIAFPLS